MNYLCVGAGSIGKRHFKNLLSLGINRNNITFVDPREDRLKEVKVLGIKETFSNLTEALNSKTFDMSIICSPTSYHIEQGIEIANKGIHILMEKPIETTTI